MKEKSKERIAMEVSWLSIMINVMLSAFKFVAGIVANSSAMMSDAIHSASDIAGTIVVMIGVKAANKESDEVHQYGHERMECVAAIVLSVVLCVVGIIIGYQGIIKIFKANDAAMTIPGVLALIAAIASIVIKEAMYWYTRIAAKKINSSALMAEAWHHRSDALSSIGSFAGIFGARMGFPVLDPLAAVVICVFIVKAACNIFMDAINKMVDKACDAKSIADIHAIVLENEGVLGLDQLKTRIFGDKIYVDIEIRVDGDATLRVAHDIAERVHGAVESRVKNVKHCMVHVNPESDKE